MPDPKKYKMVLDTGGSLYSWTDERGNWICEIKGAAKWFALVRNNEPIWVSCRKWDKLPETFEIDQAAWNEFRQEVQKREEEKQPEASIEEEEGITDEIKTKAVEILKTGKPIEYFLNTYNKIHVGDRDLGQLLMYCTGSQLNKTSNGLHPKLSGESGMGKSDAVETFLHCLPKCAYIKTSLSSKAIFYHDIKPGTIIFLDDYKQNDDLDAIIKQTSSRFHESYQHMTIDKDREAQVMVAPPEIVWAITSVDSSQDIQVLNRQVGLDVDGSEDQTKAVIEHLLEQAATGEERFPVTEDVLICRAMVLELKKHNFKVVIPFAKRIKWIDLSSRRNPSIFLDLVRANAVWHFMQRIVLDDEYLSATEQDFTDAKALYLGRADTLIDKLSKPERRLAEAILKNNGEMYREEAAEKLKVSVNRISQLVHGENGKTGLLQKLPGFNVDKVTLKDDTRNISKVMLTLVGYNRFNGFDMIVTLEPEASKDGVSDELTPKNVSSDISSKLISNIDNIIERDLHTTKNTKLNSTLNPKNALLSYEAATDNENATYGVPNTKLTSEEDKMIKPMADEERLEHGLGKIDHPTPTNPQSTCKRIMERIRKSGKPVTNFAVRTEMHIAGYDLSGKEIEELMGGD